MKIRGTVIFLSFLVCLEAFIAIVLLKENRSYQRTNRQLIIQNDSILSVNMKLSETTTRDMKQASTYRNSR